MSDTFEVSCRHCGARVEATVPAGRSVKPFSCPGCGRMLVVDARMAGTPRPQHDTRQSPASGAKVTHLFSQRSQETCGVCGNLLDKYAHDECEAAEQVESYDPS